MGKLVRRLAVLGDVHGDSVRLAAAFEEVGRMEGIDATVCTGDIVNLEAETEACCRILQEAGVQVVRGNHDRWFLENLGFYLAEDERPGRVSLQSRAFISSLPPVREIETTNGVALLCHGVGDNDMASVYPAHLNASTYGELIAKMLVATGRYRWMICGHSHMRMVRDMGGMTIINAGTVCADPRPGFAVVDFEARQVQVYDIDETLAVRPAERLDLPSD